MIVHPTLKVHIVQEQKRPSVSTRVLGEMRNLWMRSVGGGWSTTRYEGNRIPYPGALKGIRTYVGKWFRAIERMSEWERKKGKWLHTIQFPREGKIQDQIIIINPSVACVGNENNENSERRWLCSSIVAIWRVLHWLILFFNLAMASLT